MIRSEFKEAISKIKGLRLKQVNLACEMMMFDFGGFDLHAQCLTRIIKNNDILVTTLDYQSWDGETDTNNDEWYNLEKYRSVIENGTVVSVKLNRMNDLTIETDNGITIQIMVENSYAHYGEEREQYRFFESDPDDDETECDRETRDNEKPLKHYVIYSKHIDIH